MPVRKTGRSRGELISQHPDHDGEDEIMIHTDIGGVIRQVGQAVLAPGGRGRAEAGTQFVNNPFESQVPGASAPPIQINPTMGSDGQCPPGSHIAVDKCSGMLYCAKNRKRRKRLLTCSDKADIAFITGTLGKGALAQTAIASLLAKCG